MVATHVWSGPRPRLAMRFGGVSTLEEIDGESFARFAPDTGLAAPFLKRRAAALAGRVQSAIKGALLPDLQNAGAIGDLAEKTSECAARLALKVGVT